MTLDPRAREVLQRIEGIAALPTIARRAIDLLDNPHSNVDQICAVASVDPGLVTLLLRTVNSAYFGLRSRVTSVKHALVILGIEKFRRLIVASALMQKFRGVSKAVDEAFWDHALHAAQWSKEIGRHLRLDNPDDLYICGLIHNTGHFVILLYFKSESKIIEAAVRSGAPPVRAEKDILGWTHAEIGAWLFHHWKMPEEIIESAFYHHHDLRRVKPKKDLRSSTLVVHLAAALTDIDPASGAYDYDEKLEKTFRSHEGLLALQDIDAVKLSDEVSAACEAVRKIFAKS
ncbi:MAG: hypothetical protein A3G34_16310 [Candidatus Lindowbacteria bacterium RIFCSPLOWO2_12_FULL_62_27]|nr:MAG: hypothetical protein A3I06_03640 [Candidatus Lindowbacteria bacterium RIFCSPLOWO2_02_FULL_62_12]OGH60487.1 MAG: hypothetical protein A3G34_16310 [Candidatus Lindowbacteria bacterium RIFCSPLOWO2_12_FULL_62_27]